MSPDDKIRLLVEYLKARSVQSKTHPSYFKLKNDLYWKQDMKYSIEFMSGETYLPIVKTYSDVIPEINGDYLIINKNIAINCAPD